MYPSKKASIFIKQNLTDLKRELDKPNKYSFSSSNVWMWELDHKRRLSAEELMPSNCGAGEDS